jgi:hypothetical protein
LIELEIEKKHTSISLQNSMDENIDNIKVFDLKVDTDSKKVEVSYL